MNTHKLSKKSIIGIACIFSYLEHSISDRKTVDKIVDHVFNYFEGWNEYCLTHTLLTDFMLFGDTFFMLTCLLYVLLISENNRCILSLILHFSLRIVSLLIIELPQPEKMIWRLPGIPDVSNDFFFSGHMGIPVILALEFLEKKQYTFALICTSCNILQGIMMVILQVHYTMDIITGILSGYVMWSMSDRVLKVKLL